MKNKILNNLKTQFIGRNIIYYDNLDSTQILAHKLVKEKIEDGSIVLTNNQTKGIGTHNRVWYSKSGENISFSIILYPECNLKKLEGLTIMIAECIAYVFEKIYGIKLSIKAPNDLIINEKKVGGILTEIATYGEKVKNLVIGIGLNVNQTVFQDEINKIATSLKLEYKKEFDRELIISQILNKFEEEYLKMIN